MPRQVRVVSVLLIVFGCLGIVLGIIVSLLLSDADSQGRPVRGVLYAAAIGQLVLSAAQVLAGVFLRAGRSWARWLAVVVCGVSLIGAGYTLLFGSVAQAVLGAVLNVVMLRLLLGAATRSWCRPVGASP